MGEIGYIIGYMCFFSFLIGVLVGWYSKKGNIDNGTN